MSNIEDDLKVLEKFMNNETQRDKLERDNRCGGWKMGDIYKRLELNPAIKNILSEREQDKARIKELEEENKRKDMFMQMAKEVIEISISKQKVKKKIREAKRNRKYANTAFEYTEEDVWDIVKDNLEELLEDKNGRI